MRLSKFLVLWLLTVAVLGGCSEDFDYDKVSSGVSLKPTVLLPSAYSDVTVEYLFSQISNAVEYYKEDGLDKVRIHTERDSCLAYGVVDLLGGDKFKTQYWGGGDLSMISFDSSNVGELFSQDVSFSFDLEETEGVDLVAFVADCLANIQYEGFSQPATLTASLCDVSKEAEVAGDGSVSFAWDDMEVDVKNSRRVVLHLNFSGEAVVNASLGSFSLMFSMPQVKSLTCSLSQPVKVKTNTLISFTHLEDFRGVGKNVEYRDPQVFLSCTNATPLDLVFAPSLVSQGSGNVVLEQSSYDIAARQVDYVSSVNKRNSNLTDFFQNVPEKMSYDAEISMSMPSGVSTISVGIDDSLFIGYRYIVPLEFKIDGEFEADTIFIGDMANLDVVKKAMMVVSATNSLPLGGSFNVQICNLANDQKLSTFVLDDVIPAPVIVNGVAKEAVTKITSSELSHENLQDLSRADALLVTSHLTTSGQYVIPTLHDRLKLDISFAFQFEVNNY